MKKALLLVGLFLLTGCDPVYFVTRQTDEIDHWTKNTVGLGQLEQMNRPLLSNDSYSAGMQQFVRADGTTVNKLVLIYQGDGWMFIEAGESLVLLIDGKRVTLQGLGSDPNRNVMMGTLVSEEAYYDLSLDQMKLIAGAKEIKGKLVGQKYYVNFRFTESNLAFAKRFIAEVAQVR